MLFHGQTFQYIPVNLQDLIEKVKYVYLDISLIDANTLLLLQSTPSYFSTCDQLHSTGAGVYHRDRQTWFHLRGMHLQNVITINEIKVIKILYFKDMYERLQVVLTHTNLNVICVQIPNNILMLMKIHQMGIQIPPKSVPILLTSH